MHRSCAKSKKENINQPTNHHYELELFIMQPMTFAMVAEHILLASLPQSGPFHAFWLANTASATASRHGRSEVI